MDTEELAKELAQAQRTYEGLLISDIPRDEPERLLNHLAYEKAKARYLRLREQFMEAIEREVASGFSESN